jgi:lysophospholipase L1-like esterase
MKADVIDLHPKAVLILAGTNDISRGIPVKTIEDNLSMIGDICHANGIVPVFASITPVSDYHKAENPRYEMTKTRPIATIVEINNWLREYCQSHHYVYVDYYNALRDSNGVLGADLADDGLHPNAKGYRIMAPLALKGLDQALSETSPDEQPASKKKRVLPFVK